MMEDLGEIRDESGFLGGHLSCATLSHNETSPARTNGLCVSDDWESSSLEREQEGGQGPPDPE